MFARIVERIAALVPSPAPQRQSAAWLTSIGGFRGPQSVPMDIYRLGEALPHGPGVFLFAGHNSRRWQAIYVGETSDLHSRTPGHETLPEAILLGATHVHIVRVPDPNMRRSMAERLVFMYGPAMNAAGAPTLAEIIASGQRPDPRPVETPRLSLASAS